MNNESELKKKEIFKSPIKNQNAFQLLQPNNMNKLLKEKLKFETSLSNKKKS